MSRSSHHGIVSRAGACVSFSSADVAGSCYKKDKVKPGPGRKSFQVSFLSCLSLLFAMLPHRQWFSKSPNTEYSTGTFKPYYLFMSNIFLMEVKGQSKPLMKTQLKNNMYLCFIICNSFPITIISLFRAKLYLQCEGSWSGPSGSWLGREPFMPKCTSERKHTGCVMGLKLEMSKHFAYPYICGINHDKIWISLGFKYSKSVSWNCS